MTPAVRALQVDAGDLAALLHLLASAVEQRGDRDACRTLRLAARAAEGLVEGLERLEDERHPQAREGA